MYGLIYELNNWTISKGGAEHQSFVEFVGNIMGSPDSKYILTAVSEER